MRYYFIYCKKMNNHLFIPIIRNLLMMIVFLGGIATIGYGQQKATQLPIHAVAKVYKDSIVLRWAPGDQNTWNMTRFKGYHVHRYDVYSADTVVAHQLTKSALLPMSHAQIKSKYKDSNPLISLLDMAMYSNVDSLVGKPDDSFVERLKDVKSTSGVLFLYGMQSADRSVEAAEAAGLRWVDHDIVPGGRYMYMITSDTSNRDFKIDTAWVAVLNIKDEVEPTPEGLRAISRDRKIELQWNRQQMGYFSTYNIERSNDGGKTWNSLTKIPYYSPYSPAAEEEAQIKKDTTGLKIISILRDYQVYIDSIPENYKEYQYRISGNNAFAETSPFCKPIKTSGIDLTPPQAPRLKSYQNIINNTVQVFWDPNTSDSDLLGYYIHSGPTVTGPFEPLSEKLLDKGNSSFTDTSAFYDGATYYVLMAVDTALNVSTSVPLMAVLVDSIPPSAPVKISGMVDSLGIVSLTWDENPEPDVKGYKIYYSYNLNGEYSQVTNFAVETNSYQDTIPIRNLDRKVYYKVVAVDFHNNHSGYSAPAILNRPIYIPPTVPRVRQIYIVEKGVLTDWIGSHSEGVAGYEIFRREREGEWEILTKIMGNADNAFKYTDTTITPNKEYFYAAETLDSTGIRSEKSDPARIMFTKTDVLTSIDDFNGIVNKKEQSVQLKWTYKLEGDYFYVIYRSTNDSPLTAWRTLEKEEMKFNDYQIDKNKTYNYAIEVRQRNSNLHSAKSKEVKILIGD